MSLHISRNFSHSNPSSSSIAGVIATVVTSPIDVVKTRLMNMKVDQNGVARYKGVFDCFLQTAKNEGLGAFFKGFGPSVSRLVPQTVLTMIFLEKFILLVEKFKK